MLLVKSTHLINSVKLVYGAVLFGITSYNIMNKNVIYDSRVQKILEKYTLTLN